MQRNITHLVMLVCCLLIGCASNKSIYSTGIDYKVKNGFYESLSLDTWKYSEPLCVKIETFHGNLGDQWSPTISIIYEILDSENFFQLALYQKSRDEENLTLRYSMKRESMDSPKKVTLVEKLPYGTELDLKFSINDNDVITLDFLDQSTDVLLGFRPEKVSFSASSIAAKILYTSDDCE